MNLVKTSVLNGVAVLIRICSSVILNKIVAIYVGPAGYAIIGQFQNLIAIVTGIASGGVANGVVKGTAENSDNPSRQHLLWRTAGTLTAVVSLVAGVVLIFLSRLLAREILGDTSLYSVFIMLGSSLFFIALNGLLLAILNGKKQIFLYVVTNIVGSIIGLIVTGLLTISFGLKGALIAFSVNQAVVFVSCFLICCRQPWFHPALLYGKVDKQILVELLKFGAMALTSVLVVPVTQILIRDHLIDEFGMISAGHWEALMRISGLYMTVITVPLSIYFLPKFAELNKVIDLRNEIITGYIFIVPVACFCAFALFILRDIVIAVLFTQDFYPMRDLFKWQVIGDVFKVMGWLLGYVFISRGMVRIYIVTEIVFGFMWYGLAVGSTHIFGFDGASIAYCLNYISYFFVLLIVLTVRFHSWNKDEDSFIRRI